jgi:hypothetical protein
MVCLLTLTLATVMPPSGEKEKRVPQFPSSMGEVMDVFDSTQVLFSFGSRHGARKGLKVDVFRTQSTFSHTASLPIGIAELVEVGTHHSVGRLVKLTWPTQIRAGDQASWQFTYRSSDWELPRVPGRWERGGAIIDLTVPKQGK